MAGMIKNVVSFGSANAIGLIARLVQEIVTRVLLVPEIMGLWNLITVVRGFGNSLDLGATVASRRKIALLSGAGRAEEITDVAWSSIVLQLAQQGLIAVGIIVFALVTIADGENGRFVVMLAAAVILVLEGFGLAFTAIYIGTETYASLSWRLALYWISYAMLLVAGVFLAGVTGLVIGVSLALALQAVLYWKGLPIDKKQVARLWNPTVKKKLLRVGIPLKIANYPQVLMHMLDVLFVSSFFPLAALAIYATAKMMVLQAIQLPNWIGNVVITRAITDYGAGEKSRERIGHDLYLYLLAYYLLAAPIILIVVERLGTTFINIFIPDYSDSLPILLVLLPVTYFMPQVTLIKQLWILEKKVASILISNTLGLIVTAGGFAFLLVRGELNLLYVAQAFLAGNLAGFLIQAIMIGRDWWSVKITAVFLTVSLASASIAYLAVDLAQASGTEDLSGLFQGLLIELAVVSPLLVIGLFVARRNKQFFHN